MTIKPRYIGGITILFWGVQLDLIWFAIPMAILLEARYFIARRWALTKTDFYQIADLTGIGLVAMVAFLFLNRSEYHFITSLISWLPILLFPLVTVLAYSTTERMTLDVLFYSLRRQKEPVQQSWDMDYVLLGTCLLAAGLNRESDIYFVVVALIVIALLYQLRSPRFGAQVFLLAAVMVLLSASVLHVGIRESHLVLKRKTEQWIANWISERVDPLRTRTAMGHVGRLKLSDAIAFRIKPHSGQADFPGLLKEAAYNTPDATIWEVFDNRFKTTPHADDYRWEFTEEPRFLFPEATIYLEFSRESSLIPVPTHLAELNELPATEVKVSPYGAVQGVGLIPSPHYKLRYGADAPLGDTPTVFDLTIPKEYEILLQSLAPAKLEGDAALRFVQNFFRDFRYTLYQSNRDIQAEPLTYFLTESRAGHCEYFASATAMLLRQLGVPSRYVVGYSVQEWNASLQMYVVRKRHAHAWAEAYIDDRWVPVDTTPAQWLHLEENESSSLQPVWDFFGNRMFLFRLWWNDQKLEDYETELFLLGLLLAGFLIWRISTSEQVITESRTTESVSDWIKPGAESPFFKVEEFLTELGYRRGQGELLKAWLLRVGHPELLPMLGPHNKWRFDPRGISMEERQDLATQVANWLSERTPSDEENSSLS